MIGTVILKHQVSLARWIYHHSAYYTTSPRLNEEITLTCTTCNASFGERSDIFRHIKETHVSKEEYLGQLEHFTVLVPEEKWWCRHCHEVVVQEHMILDHACGKDASMLNCQAWKL